MERSFPEKMCLSVRSKCAVCSPRSFISRWDHRRLKRRNFSETCVTGCCNRGTRPLFSSALSRFHRWLLQTNYEYAVHEFFYEYFVLLLLLEHHDCQHRTIIENTRTRRNLNYAPHDIPLARLLKKSSLYHIKSKPHQILLWAANQLTKKCPQEGRWFISDTFARRSCPK